MRRLRSDLRIEIKEYWDWNWSTRPHRASDACALVHFDLSWTIVFCHSAMFCPNTPIMFGFSESAHMCLSFCQEMETFLGRCWETPGNVWKFELSKILIDHKTPWFCTKQSPESPPEVFLVGEHNTKKKNQLQSISSSRIPPFEEKNKDVFLRFYRLSAHFRPHPGTLFYPNTHNFFAVISIKKMMIWAKKKTSHFREKYLGLDLSWVCWYMRDCVKQIR